MTNLSDIDQPDAETAAQSYLSRRPESLVVNSYRGWLLFAAERRSSHLNAVWEQLIGSLGKRDGCLAMDGIQRLVRQLGKCATCPLRFTPPQSRQLCRDECLMLGLVSGLQNGEDDAAIESAAALTCPARTPEILAAGGEFAMVLKFGGMQLLPIHAETIRWIARGGGERAPKTIH